MLWNICPFREDPSVRRQRGSSCGGGHLHLYVCPHVSCLSAPGSHVGHFVAFVIDPWETCAHAELTDGRRSDCPAERCVADKVPVWEEAAEPPGGGPDQGWTPNQWERQFIPRLEENVSLQASSCGRNPSTQPAFVFANKVLKTSVPTTGMSVCHLWFPLVLVLKCSPIPSFSLTGPKWPNPNTNLIKKRP